jgi:hypothetical protein
MDRTRFQIAEGKYSGSLAFDRDDLENEITDVHDPYRGRDIS